MPEQISDKLRDMAAKPFKEADRYMLCKAADEIERLRTMLRMSKYTGRKPS